MGEDKLLKKVFLTCRPTTESMATTWCGRTKKLLVDLGLGHIWYSGEVGSSRDWEKVIYPSIAARELQEWRKELLKKDKLCLYRMLKMDLRRESYLSLPMDRRRRLTEMRCGTHCLDIETGRWQQIAREVRFCRVCACGPIEDELHVLLDCYQYRKLREQMIKTIEAKTGYVLSVMDGDREWLRDFLLGCGVSESKTRITVAAVVGTSFNKALKRRKEILCQVSRVNVGLED